MADDPNKLTARRERLRRRRKASMTATTRAPPTPPATPQMRAVLDDLIVLGLGVGAADVVSRLCDVVVDASDEDKELLSSELVLCLTEKSASI